MRTWRQRKIRVELIVRGAYLERRTAEVKGLNFGGESGSGKKSLAGNMPEAGSGGANGSNSC